MDEFTTAEARKNLADLLNRVAYARERVVVTRRGRELAALVPVDDASLSERLRSFLASREVVEALGQLEDDQAASWAELKRDLGL
ncbi:MAG: type II toxin-antitoxin system Phd/YefM family antitoxin [Longimicrobiales bacterium]